MNRTFNIVFALFVIIDLIILQFYETSAIRYFSKPAIVGSLIVLVLRQSFHTGRLKNAILFALTFSLVGDLLLLFSGKAEIYFIMGLLSFLLAHAWYIIALVPRGYFHRARFPVSILLIVIYSFVIYWYIADGLGDNQPYVGAYIGILVLLSVVAFFRQSFVSKRSYQWVLAGALLFMLSDSILAVDTFKIDIAYSGLAVMITYALAQWFLVNGALEQNRPEDA